VSHDTPVTGPQSNRYPLEVPLPSLGRTKNGRHRDAAPQQVEAAPDHDLENYLAALAPEGDVETTETGRRFGNAQVYQLRLSLEANEQLRQLAARHQTSPLALAQEWITQRLAWETQGQQQNRY
jgi:hypothetical protein